MPPTPQGWLGRLEEGLEHGLDFVLAKATISLLAAGTPPADVLRTIGRYGLRYRQRGWSAGMTILTTVGSVLPALAPEDRPLALFHGAVRVAEDTAGSAPRFDLELLPATSVPPDRLKTWFRRAVEVRDQNGAERVLQTAIASNASPTALSDLLLVAATDHVYLDAGHVLDFINKACEYLDLVGWSEASLVLPDIGQVSFGGINGRTLLMVGLGVCALGLLFGLTVFTQLKNLPVHASMLEVSELIYETCKTYLITQGKFLLVLWLLGFLAFHVTAGTIHILLVLALIFVVMHFFRGRGATV